MLLLKYLLVVASIGFFGAAAAVLVADVVKAMRSAEPLAVRWRLAARLALFAWLPLLPALSIVVVPSGMAGVRVSQLSGTLGGTLYPGTHLVMPLVHRVELFNIRDQVFATNPNDAPNTDFSGYNFWLQKLNDFNGNFIQAEMVKAMRFQTRSPMRSRSATRQPGRWHWRWARVIDDSRDGQPIRRRLLHPRR